jgi:hypothetical protein
VTPREYIDGGKFYERETIMQFHTWKETFTVYHGVCTYLLLDCRTTYEFKNYFEAIVQNVWNITCYLWNPPLHHRWLLSLHLLLLSASAFQQISFPHLKKCIFIHSFNKQWCRQWWFVQWNTLYEKLLGIQIWLHIPILHKEHVYNY